MDSPDVVDTSDVEEREVLVLSPDVDHQTSSASPRVDANVLVSPKCIITENRYQHPPGALLTRMTRFNEFNNYQVENPSPRKRIKIAHDSGSVSPGFSDSMFVEASFPSTSLPEVAPKEQIPSSPSNHSQACMPEVWSQSTESHSASEQLPRSSSRSLSLVSDHDSLFSSPHRHPTTPPRTSQFSHDQHSPASQRPYSVTSSPLTLLSSPAPLPQTLLQSPDPVQLVSPRRPQTPQSLSFRSTLSPIIPQPVRLPLVVIPEDPQPLARYSLRRREARQLNPYAYDKLLYKQQLKSHPDAIVKFPSSRRHTGSAEDGTQDEFVFTLDNPEEDGDYVDVEGEGGRRRSKARSFDRSHELGEVGQGLEVRQKGWLPETLKGLSSDEDDDESSKLAKKIRRDREKAEAKARAGARRAAAEARRAEVENKTSMKKRPKPFPVRRNAEGKTLPFPGHVHHNEPLPSPTLFSRAHSEPVMAAYPLSPVRSPFRPPAPSRASSNSPTFGSGRLQSPDFHVYAQQQDSFRFNDDDFDPPFPRNDSPVDEFITYSAPPSPSGPPTTSGASALPSNTSGMDSESDQPSAPEMNSKDRKRLRALKRMMPAAMIARQFGAAKTAHPPPRMRVPVESSGSEAEEVRVIPGVARIGKGRYKDVEVLGDPESSDVEPPAEVLDDNRREGTSPGAMEIFSDGQSAVSVRRSRPPRPRHEDDVISLSDSSMPEFSSEDSESSSDDDGRAPQPFFNRPPRGPARERSLIDWMLSRTRDSGRSKSRVKKPTGRRKPRWSGPPRLNIVTSGARRYGEQHQTLLPFVRADTNSNTTSSTKHSSEHRDRNRVAQLDQDTVEEHKRRKRKWKSNTHGPVHSIHHDATRITSKHREVKARRDRLVIDQDDEDLRQALDPGWKAEVERWNKPVSSARPPAAKPATSAPTAPRPRLYRRPSPRPQHEIPLPAYFQRKEGSSPPIHHHHVVVDMNISPFPSGVKFGSSSYVGKGLLYQLISVTSGNSEVAQPMYCNMQGLEIGPATSASVFTALFGSMFDRLASALREFKADNMDTMKDWESVARASSQLLSSLAVHAEDHEFFALEVALRESSEGLLLVLDSLETNIFTLAAHWFVVELAARLVTGVKYRRRSVENGHLMRSAKQLMQHLLSVDLQPAFATFHVAQADADDTSLPHRAVGLWVCLIHLLPNFEIFPEVAPGHPVWRLLADLHPESSPTGTEASENMWRAIFSLCAISQFSVHGLSTSVFRLPAAWELVAAALKKIILVSDPENDCRLLPCTLQKRDQYVSYVVSRCFLLWKRWDWRLDDGIAMFKSLQEIFRSRNFGNLLHERRSVLMGFIENADLELLSKQDPIDTVFEIFLKMVVQAVNLQNKDVELDPKQRSVNIKKLLQMAVPVSPVPFSRSAPPSKHSVSMLVNRFSAMAVAIHLDPTSSNVKFRIGQARRCVSFRDGDHHSRGACIYGMMNFAMIVRHHKIVGGLEDVLGWLREMTDILMDEYKEGETGSQVKMTATTLVQLLIGSVRRVMETQSLDKEYNHVEYPDPALLDGPWVTRVFNPRTDLLTIQQTGYEIRTLVQSFLDARLKALPDVQPPPLPVVHSAESQESQNEWDKVYSNINEEELVAALDKDGVSANAALKLKEDALCKVLDKFITPAMYRLVCKYLGEGEHAKDGATSAQAADPWIDCWVGCANVLVQNGYKDWGLYMKLGQQSWEKIINDSWRRRVGLRFNLTLLRLDPGAYNKMKDDFIAVLLVAILSHKMTIEHEFLSVILSLDGLRHPLLRGAPLDLVPGTRKYEVSRTDYEAVRGRLIETVFTNTAGRLREKVDGESQAYAELVVVMLSTMRGVHEELAEEKVGYGEFCRTVFHMLSGQPELMSHPRISGGLAWGRMEWNVQ